jgi:hypothetical protein
MDKLWLPEGAHSDLNIEHSRGQGSGSFTGGGWKLCWHITVSPWASVDAMVSVLKSKNAAPHLVIGGRPGWQYPVVVQMLPFNEAGRALEHVLPQETNRANTIQVEICARPGNVRQGRHEDMGSSLFDLPGIHVPDAVLRQADAGEDVDFDLCMGENSGVARSFYSGVAAWSEDTYRALANLTTWVDNRVPIPKRQARSFQNTNRFSGPGWVSTKGHLGHMHCPGNSHYDPTTAFRGGHLMRLLAGAPYEL